MQCIFILSSGGGYLNKIQFSPRKIPVCFQLKVFNARPQYGKNFSNRIVNEV